MSTYLSLSWAAKCTPDSVIHTLKGFCFHLLNLFKTWLFDEIIVTILFFMYY